MKRLGIPIPEWKSANEIGMKTVWVKQGYGKYWSFSSDPESRMAEKADFEVDDLSGLLKIF